MFPKNKNRLFCYPNRSAWKGGGGGGGGGGEQWSAFTRWPDASTNSHRASYITILVARRDIQPIPTREYLHKLLIVVVSIPQPLHSLR